MGFRFEKANSLRLFCDFHLTKDHPFWEDFDREDRWACYKSGSILFRNCKKISLATGYTFPRDTDGFDADQLDIFEIHDTSVKVETNCLRFEIQTTEFDVVIDKAS